MSPHPLWSGMLRLSLVTIPVKLYAAVTTGEKISFRMIHKPSGKPIKYNKVVETDAGVKSVPEEEIVKGYEFARGQHVLLRQEELDEYKVEAKPSIELGRFVEAEAIDQRYFEKPYYLLPDGEVAKEGYTVIQKALTKTGKVAIGQLTMHGRSRLVGIQAIGKGLLLEILRRQSELRDEEDYFGKLGQAKVKKDGVAMAKSLMRASRAGSSRRRSPTIMPSPCGRWCSPRSSPRRRRWRLSRHASCPRWSTSWKR
jgi:DNA end-binding protein Ku